MKYVKRSLGQITIKLNGSVGVCSWPKGVNSNEELLEEELKKINIHGVYTVYGLFDKKECVAIDFHLLRRN
jgi:hypothetical protein